MFYIFHYNLCSFSFFFNIKIHFELFIKLCIGIVVLGGLGDIRINLVLHLLCKTKKGITSRIIDILTLLTLTIVMGSISDTRLLKHTQRLINSGFTAQVEL